MILSALENKTVTKRDVGTPIFEKTCDVLVIGAGSAGCYAADSAARAGAKVILSEISNNIGGMSVTGNVTGYYYGMQGGSFALDDKKSREDTAFLTNRAQWEQRQIHITERLLDSGVEILAGHSSVGLYFDGDRVVGIRAFDGERCFNVRAAITVDATSDGHLIRMTDVELLARIIQCEAGGEGEQGMQAVALVLLHPKYPACPSRPTLLQEISQS